MPRLRNVARIVAGAALAGIAAATLLPSSAAGALGTTGPVMGVYRGAGATGVSRIPAYEAWTGRPISYALDFAASATWADLTGPSWQLDAWRDSGKRLVYSFALFPKPTTTSAGSLTECAAGNYNGYWRTLGQNLVAKSLEDTILRPGWEFNGAWFWWTAKDNPAAFAGCFRNVVTTMRAVAGSRFEFDWNPAVGYTPMTSPELAWPGDAYVDYVGVDMYDQSWAQGTYPISSTATAAQKLLAWTTAWNDILNGRHGLAFWSTFAKAHGKRMSLPEWGSTIRPDGHSGGDNPYYIEQTMRWLRDPANNVAYALYFEFDWHDGKHMLNRTDGLFQNAAAKYLELLRAAPTTTVSPSASPVASPSASPSPLAVPAVSSPAPVATSPSPSPIVTSSPTAPCIRKKGWKWINC